MYPSHGNPGNTTSSSSGLRQPSHSHSHSQSLLQTRIAAKRAELENLRALRDLSANLATQLSTLEEKLGTLRDGSQSVALVLANWENVLRAINMAANRRHYAYFFPSSSTPETRQKDSSEPEKLIQWVQTVKVPKPANVDEDENQDADAAGDTRGTSGPSAQDLPVPLVRIPVQPKTEDGS
ncbi:DASH complex subunit dad2 [Exophiala dermatitidis]|nr:DASH complex subunit dad2 [Exophiala dermatitidis]KAJ4539034.1 DASH complex subunit dad2 [Exophiala dermatitidis]